MFAQSVPENIKENSTISLHAVAGDQLSASHGVLKPGFPPIKTMAWFEIPSSGISACTGIPYHFAFGVFLCSHVRIGILGSYGVYTRVYSTCRRLLFAEFPGTKLVLNCGQFHSNLMLYHGKLPNLLRVSTRLTNPHRGAFQSAAA